MLIALGAPNAPARAEERDFCADRPGLGTPACTVAPGEAMVEVGLGEWDHTTSTDAVNDVVTIGQVDLRLGLTQRSEVLLGFGGWTHQRDRAGGAIAAAAGTGDITIGIKRGLAGPDGPFAVQAFVTLPAGKGPGTAGDWGAGAVLPVNLTLPHGFEFDLTPEIDAAVNASGSGRHLAYGSVFGLSHPLGGAAAIAAEVSLSRDLDPAGKETQALAALSLAWQAGPRFQIDLEGDCRLAGSEPDHALMIGFARRF